MFSKLNPASLIRSLIKPRVVDTDTKNNDRGISLEEAKNGVNKENPAEVTERMMHQARGTWR